MNWVERRRHLLNLELDLLRATIERAKVDVERVEAELDAIAARDKVEKIEADVGLEPETWRKRWAGAHKALRRATDAQADWTLRAAAAYALETEAMKAWGRASCEACQELAADGTTAARDREAGDGQN